MPVYGHAIVETTDIARAIADDQEVLVPRCDVGMPGQNLLPVLRLVHGDLAAVVHSLRERAAEGLRNMLGNDHAGRIRR